MGVIGEKRRFESVEPSFVVGKGVNDYCSEKVVETSAQDAKKLFSVKKEISSEEEQHMSLVCVTYRSLPRKSKKKLEEVLFGWYAWHSQHSKSDSEEELESGESLYYPALHLGAATASTLSFLSDVPLIKKHCAGLTGIDKELVPLYDRGFAAPLCLNNSDSESKSGLQGREDTRCFNCGSYDHSLKDCSKEKDIGAITNARKQHQAKKKGNSRPRVPTRYFQDSPAGKYDGLKQGSLSTETRQLLGIGEQDPVPWHNRIQKLGYPPGNTGVEAEPEEQPSGITIITGDETLVENNDISGSNISNPVKIKSEWLPEMNIRTEKTNAPDKCDTPHPRGVDIPTKKPSYLPQSEVYYRRQMPDSSWGDRDLRISRSFGATSALDSFSAERGFYDARLSGRFDDSPPNNLFRDVDRGYMDARFSGSFRGSPPRYNSLWSDRFSRDNRFSPSLVVGPPSPNYNSVYSSYTTDGPRRYFSQGNYMGRLRSPDSWGSFRSVDERFSFHSPRDHLPFSLSPPDDRPVFPIHHQTYGGHPL